MKTISLANAISLGFSLGLKQVVGREFPLIDRGVVGLRSESDAEELHSLIPVAEKA